MTGAGAGAGVPRGQAVLLVSAVAGMAVSFALTVLAGRGTDAAGFGLFTLVGAFLALARDLSDLGSGAVAVRAAARNPAAERRALEDLLQWRFATTMLLAVACTGYAAIRGEPVLAATAIVVLATTHNGLVAVFQLRGRLDRAAWINVGAQGFALVLAAGVAWAGARAGWAFAAVLLARELAVVIAGRRAALRLAGFVPRIRPLRMRWRALWSATSVYAAAALLFHLLVNAGTFVAGLLATAQPFAAYAAAFRLMTPAFGLPWLLTAPLVPLFARLATADPAAFARQAGATLLLAAGGAAILAVAGALLADDIVALLFGERLAAAATPLRWLMLAFVGVTVTAVRAPLLLAMGREGVLLRLAATGCAATVAMQMVLLPLTGVDGLAAAVAAGALATAAMPAGGAGQPASLGNAPLLALLLVAGTGLGVAVLPVAGSVAGPVAGPLVRVAAGGGIALAALVLLYRLAPIAAARREQMAVER